VDPNRIVASDYCTGRTSSNPLGFTHRPVAALANRLIAAFLLILFSIYATPAQNEADEYRDGPGLQVVDFQITITDATPDVKLPDRINVKVKNTGTKAITAFSFDLVIFDANRTDTISSAQTFAIKKTIKPGESKDVSSRIQHLDRTNPNNMVRIVKIAYADGDSWDRFQK
jgi:hypothetical protein